MHLYLLTCTRPIMATKQGDYQYDFVDPLPEECPCLVCLEVQVDPHQVTCCGKIFCKSCLDQLINIGQKCPNCRKNISCDKFFPDLNTERKIKHLQVRCENHTRGCKWVGYLKDLKPVHVPKCPNHLVPCTNIAENDPFSRVRLTAPECGISVQRCDLSKHMTRSCKWREANCNFCKSKGTYQFINGGHTDICPDYIVVCSNEGCEIKIKRKDLPEHKTTCPKQIVSCRYSSVGCKASITRENIVSHNQECMDQHLDSAVGRLEKAFKRIEILEAKALKHSVVHVEVATPLHINTHYDDDEDYDERCDRCGDYHPDSYDCHHDDSDVYDDYDDDRDDYCADCGDVHPGSYDCRRDDRDVYDHDDD